MDAIRVSKGPSLAWVALLSLLSAPVLAQSGTIGTITVTPTNQTVAAGGSFGLTFYFDFGGDSSTPGTTVSSFDYTLTYDSTQLTLDPGQMAAITGASGTFTPFGSDQSLSAAGTYGATAYSDSQEHLYALWEAVDGNGNPTLPLALWGQNSVTYEFMLASGAAVGSTTNVTLSLDYTDGNLNYYDTQDFSAVITAATQTVPLPASAVLLFSGLGLLLVGRPLRRDRAAH